MASLSPDVLEAAPRVTELLVTGMNCANCARHVTDALQSVPGVDSADVSLQEGRARVRWQAGSGGRVAELLDAVSAAGYQANPVPVPKPRRINPLSCRAGASTSSSAWRAQLRSWPGNGFFIGARWPGFNGSLSRWRCRCRFCAARAFIAAHGDNSARVRRTWTPLSHWVRQRRLVTACGHCSRARAGIFISWKLRPLSRSSASAIGWRNWPAAARKVPCAPFSASPRKLPAAKMPMEPKRKSPSRASAPATSSCCALASACRPTAK